MSTWALILAFILYVIIAIDSIRKRDYPMGLVWVSYSLSQLGFLWYELTRHD